jgi:hypothetical protein
MELSVYETPEPDSPTNTVTNRLGRVLAEQLDPADTHECLVAITTVTTDEAAAHRGSSIPSGGTDTLLATYGLKITMAFESYEDSLHRRVDDIMRTFEDSCPYEFYKIGSYSGEEVTADALIFPILDTQLTFGVAVPDWEKKQV